MRVRTLLVIAALVIFVSVAPTTFAQNLLTNGSFETGDFTGWTTGGNFEDTEVVTGAFYQYSGAENGNYYAVMGPVGSPGTLSQSFSDVAGQQYTFSFWFASVGDNPSSFTAMWDGTQVLNLSNPNTGANWSQFTFTETGTGSDSITFSFQDNPGWMALDNVSVTQQSGATVPEPSSFILLGSGVLGLGGIIRRKLYR
ncbi:MAG TPA: PEP-CTERM sorting domain-containing protein [Terriglobales bacterium]|nr:PEP-CTERM sorting domain-containing protein [Terriglobales bacterium]